MEAGWRSPLYVGEQCFVNTLRMHEDYGSRSMSVSVCV